MSTPSLASETFAIVDVETTGFSRSDRIVEVSVVRMRGDGTPIDEYDTLVHPERGVGPTSIHRISQADIDDAPRFVEIAGELGRRLADAIVVAHNASFDLRFLTNEFGRLGEQPPSPPSLCTLKLSRRLELPLRSRKLTACCRDAGIQLTDGHAALLDARAAAQLLGVYLGIARQKGLTTLAALGCENPQASRAWPVLPTTGRRKSRSTLALRQGPGPSLARLVAQIDIGAADAALAAYFDLLDRVLLDQTITPSESAELESFARVLGLGPAGVRAGHRQYVDALIASARVDKHITADDWRQLERTARLLGIHTTIAVGSGGPARAAGKASLDVESVRVSEERTLLERLTAEPSFAAVRERLSPPPAEVIRRTLMGKSLRLTEGMAPEAYAAAREALGALGIDKPIEIYQASGRENAAIHLVDEPIILEIQGRLLTLLDPGTAVALFGHELGHYLAHGPQGTLGREVVLADAVASADGAVEGLHRLASAVVLLKELTADRFALLACQDLDAVLRLEMIATTGLPAAGITYDTKAYLAQCRELMETALASGKGVLGMEHPEHNLRAYAAWLFSESDVYRANTGKGPGTRPIGEVDAVLARIINRGDLDLTYHPLDEPPSELYECALACSVLVARADGTFADEEVETIERVFAGLVPDWRGYLDGDTAVRRFKDVSGVIASADPGTQRSLFYLLVNVMCADGLVDAREIGTLLAIGEALGCGTMYRSLLGPLLRHLGATFDETPRPISLPLPPRTGEGEAALQTYLEGFVRRGSGDTTLRRLLRFLGATQRSPDLVAAITRELSAAGLTLDAALDEVGIDERLRVTCPGKGDERAEVRPQPSDTGPGFARLVRALARLRDELVSGDGRSRSVRLNVPRPGKVMDLHALELVSVGLSERVLAQLVAGKRARVLDAAEVGTHEGAKRVSSELVDLDREHRMVLEETGANDLFLGYPVLSGVVEGYLVRAPLVLHPVTIERDARGARSFTLVPRKDDVPVANQALLRLVFSKRKFAFPDELSEELDVLAADNAAGPAAILQRLHDVGLPAQALSGELGPFRDRRPETDSWIDRKQTHFEVEECALLGLFPQSSSDLLQDYDGLLEALARPGSTPETLLGCATEILPADVRETFARPVAATSDASPLIPVIHADPSQRNVLVRARTARALVVDGPPGTGKSQVIVNLVADAIGRGERVAVVSEKRAALDVVMQRLGIAGLGHAAALVHDVYEDRRSLYQHLAGRLEGEANVTARGAELQALQAELDSLTAQLVNRAEQLGRRPPGVPLSVGQLHALAAGLDVPGLSAPALGVLDLASAERFAAELAGLSSYADLFAAESPWFSTPNVRGRRRRLMELSDDERRAVEGALVQALEAAEAAEAARTRSPVPVEAVLAARQALETAATAATAWQSEPDEDEFPALVRAALQDPTQIAGLDQALALWEEHREVVERVDRRVTWRVSPERERAVAIATAWAVRFLRFFVLAWWRARAEVRRLLLDVWPERSADALGAALLGEVRDRLHASRAWAAIDEVRRGLGLSQRGIERALAVTAWSGRCKTLAAHVNAIVRRRSELTVAGAWPDLAVADGGAAWQRVIEERQALLATHATLLAAVEPIREVFPHVGEAPTSDELRTLLGAWRRDAGRAAEADRRLGSARAVVTEVLPIVHQFAMHLEAADAHTWRAAATKAWALAVLQRVERTDADAMGDVAAIEGALRRAVARAAELEKARILARLDANGLLQATRPEKHQRRTTEQATREAMLKECKKQRNILPLRSFVRRFAATGLLDVVPVWLVSPETMAVLFPREPLFDLVVFDEASQCTVQSGLPVLLRGRRVVVAGDDKQMPPTSFFTAQAPSDEDEVVVDEVSGRRDLLDEESLLTLARNRTEHAGLKWHYRCREEELIAFSNHSMYAGELLSIPSTSTRSAVASLRWIEVQEPRYEAGRNEPEARRVVDVLHDLLRRVPRLTIGVVTFNIQQRKAILDEIDRRRATDADFTACFDEAASSERLDERPFVKNLENVQGDERDVIIFSLGHAPIERMVRGQPTKTVLSRFGPLGQKGGERRLNVAISRARAECVIVASFEPSMLSVAKTRHDGPKLFKAFLEYAWHLSNGRRTQAERVLDLVRASERASYRTDDPGVYGYVSLKAQIASALERRGIQCELDVGTSGFRVPVAVVSASDPARYTLAILCDDGAAPLEVFDAHVQRPQALEARGWKVTRISARDWARDPERVLDRVVEGSAE
ncbi:exonuclease domain-containing protein [Nannocystis sp. ILAH1]|uniref:exonuclease domain-containing protein n=1 Tax=Nannocystis sp. ILAH1 TaxID=2996789 RepID=UPI0022708454|nr:exonuclease domain-containing protein [Nannocystis sp. ILAH1]MCY0989446.1 exonuclease domain-containing protein [Nannocystis sp. ILAH1]